MSTVAGNVATTRLEALGLSCHIECLSDALSVDASPCKTGQKARIELLINGLEVRVLPGSPLTSPKCFTSHQFGRPPGVTADAELRTSENKTPATRSTAFLCESETVWVYTFSVVSRTASVLAG